MRNVLGGYAAVISRMKKRHSTYIRQFHESEVGAVRSLIHHTIDVCYSPVYPPLSIATYWMHILTVQDKGRVPNSTSLFFRIRGQDRGF